MGRINKGFNYRHIIAMAIVVASLLCSIFLYQESFIRATETVVDFFTSIRYYFVSLVDPKTTLDVTINNVSSIPSDFVFPLNWEEFKATVSLWFNALFDSANFNNFLVEASDVMLVISMLFQLLVMVIMMINVSLDSAIENKNNDYNVDSKNLKRYKRFEKKVLWRIKFWLQEFFEFFKAPRRFKYSKIFILIWLYNLNVLNMIGEAIAFLFYFVSSLNFPTLYIQFYKLLFDVFLMFKGLPWYLWIVVFALLISKIRLNVAYKRLYHMQSKNCGFVKALSTCTLFSAPMNAGKTKLMTSMHLTATTVFKHTAKESLLKADYKFPNFPFVIFENELRRLVREHEIYSLATIEVWIKSIKREFDYIYSEECEIVEKYKASRKVLFGYYWKDYGLTYNNGMYIETIFDVLDTYAKAYFVYVLECSFGVSNYAIREDNKLESLGNFPLWDFDFFKRKPEELDEISYHSKILDFDILRKGKHVVELNEFADTFEFGVVVITELDKERGNSLDTNELKKLAEEANQKNDLFNYSLKMGRHPSTIDYKPYAKFFFDLQREMKVDADLREVCGEILTICDVLEKELSMPFFFLEEFFYGLTFGRFNDMYEQYRFYRGDNTLFMYLIKKFATGFFNYYSRIYNRFGYDVMSLSITNGRQEEIPVVKDYYVMYKKDFARRYCTDSHSDFYRKASLKKKFGLIDYPSYDSERASLDELRQQNSYFIRDLDNISKRDDED